MSFRIKICYSEIYRKSYYLSIQRGHILPYASYGSKNIVRNLENENCVVTQHNIY